MNNLILTLALSCVCILQSCCKNKNPKVTTTYELSEEMMAYFVNYEVGTKWIYQDTIDKNNFDTIELISKMESNSNVRGTLYKGFILNYLPKKSKNFQVRIDPGANNIYYVKVDPMVTATGAIIFENNNGSWKLGVTHFDSIEIIGNLYYNVINSKSNNMYQHYMHISKGIGIIYFVYDNNDPRNSYGAAYALLKIIKP